MAHQHLHLRGGGDNLRRINMLPFSDWLAHVERTLDRRTGERLVVNEVPRDYWIGLYHIGESWQDAADNFIEDRS
jgi:hypothetical protein